MKKRFMLSTAAATTVAMATVASADVHYFDISGDYISGVYSHVSNTIDGGGAVILSYGYSVDLTIYHNSASSYSNWGSEARFGIGSFEYSGSPNYYWMGSVTSEQGAASAGASIVFSGITGSAYVGSYGFLASSSFGFAAYSTWNDGSGAAAGTFNGTGWVNLAAVPAPGALALLGLAGVASRRRRK